MADALPLDRTLLRPGMRLAVAVSGGADSIALLWTLVHAAPEIGLVLSVAHMHHGIRGPHADSDAAFVAQLAAELGLPFHRKDVNAVAEARTHRESLEESARRLRYTWFRELLASGQIDAVATAHTLNDQAETVLHRLLRGAWTEGLSGIYPSLNEQHGAIIRPFLAVPREDIITWLSYTGHPWREDATNADTTYTRNRLRHELLPALSTFNPQICGQLANLATLARDEEAYWQSELMRILPQLLLPGRPVRGGGRAASTDPAKAALALEIERLPHPPALRRRILRAAARQLGVSLNFHQTELLLAMCSPNGPRRQTLTSTLQAVRSPRELQLIKTSTPPCDRSE